NYETIVERLRESAFLQSGLKIIVTDNRGEEPVSETFQYDDGLNAFVAFLNEGKSTIGRTVNFSGTVSDIEVNISFQFNDQYSETILSFVNNVRTKDGGTHEVGFKT